MDNLSLWGGRTRRFSSGHLGVIIPNRSPK